MEAADIEEMGPIDYVLIEWADSEPTGEAVPIVLDLVDRGIIRVLDFALFAKNEDGDVAAIDFGELPEHAAALGEFRGASSGVLADEDLAEAADAISPGALDTSRAVLSLDPEVDVAAEMEQRGRRLPVGRVGRPTDVASAVRYLASDGAEFMTGQMLVLDGGEPAPFPLPRPAEEAS